MTAPFILGLDISKTCTGICFGQVGAVPKFASIKSSGVDDGVALCRLGEWLIDFPKINGRPDAVFFEGQINMAAFMGRYDEEKGKVSMSSSPDITITLAKLVGIVEFICGMKKLRCESMTVNTVRKAFLGNGGLKKEVAKPAAKRLCHALGWEPSNTDESDAGAVWYAGGLRIAPQKTQIITPMMQSAAIAGTARRTPSGALL